MHIKKGKTKLVLGTNKKKTKKTCGIQFIKHVLF